MAFTHVNVSKQRLVLVQGNNCANPPEECSPAHDKIQDKKSSPLRCLRRRMVFDAGNTTSVFTSTRCVKSVVGDTTGGLVSSKVADIPYEARVSPGYRVGEVYLSAESRKVPVVLPKDKARRREHATGRQGRIYRRVLHSGAEYEVNLETINAYSSRSANNFQCFLSGYVKF
ncbi:unnamed protein product [Porites evermanni]|uniref:Uncharacterized protein n=1 Tax=Porites evermanni TaxID=104178 RepID=A0ABN8LGF3_9CNID|nr:unnamed protein product [Porites evermanni]CAH3016161.1 unnamed protein product [Porites evermanni]